MNFTQSLFRNSFFFLLLIPVFAVWGFWVTYFTRPAGSVSFLEHLHGVALFGWLGLLVVQSLLVRTGHRSLHRAIGKLSWVMGPLIVVSTIWVANLRLNQRGMTPEGLYIFGLQFFLIIAFAVFWLLAMLRRKRPDVHARWMICTALTMLDPIFARILGINFIHVPFETGIIQYYTFALIDLILLALVLRDLKAPSRKDVFLPALVLFLVLQAAMLSVLKVPAWTTFATWFAALPLS
jgi:hypothetical protein